MKKIDTILHDALIKNGALGQERLDAAVADAQKSQESLFAVIMRGNVMPEQPLLQLLAKELSMPFVDLYHLTIEKSVALRVPQKVAAYYKFLPIKMSERVLTVGVSYPLELKMLDEIRVQLGFEVEQVLMTSTDLAEGLRMCYGSPTETLGKLASQVYQDGRQEELPEKMEDIARLAGDASIIKLVNQIIIDGYHKRATDIHIEPYRQEVSIRYRVDGILYDSPVMPEMKGLVNAIISRIKIMSNLNIVERRLPQDGRAVVKVADQVLDLRISTIPTQFGESLVIRVLPTHMLFDLAKLGLSKKDQVLFEMFIQKPHGIIFVTGPTGSGKTTTLYACLSKINKRDRKIITIEDPIEYEMQGVTQIQVQPEIGLDFARGLRSILRHDPDVIMVGEVRDLETAEIAIRVALTGHLVFSTLHTNDASSGITRLMDIGLEPYLVASSIEAFIAQRLIRMICPKCKYEDHDASKELKRMIAYSLKIKFEEVRIFRGKGCSHCGGTGYFGRSAIYEIIQIDDAIKELILQKASAGHIKKAAIQRGMRTLAQDGWQKTIDGFTTPEEIIRVTEADDNIPDDDSGFSQEKSVRETAANPWIAKRAFKRVDESIGIRYRVFRPGEDVTQRGQHPDKISVTKDISAGGLLFVSDDILTEGQVLEIYVDLPRSQETIDCLARVVKVVDTGHRFDISVCFLDLTGAQRARLDEYVNAESETKQ